MSSEHPAAYSDDGEPVVSQEASASGRPSQVPAATDTGATEAAGHPSSVLPNLISLTPEAVADAVAEWLTEQVADDTRAYGVAGPIDGRVILLLMLVAFHERHAAPPGFDSKPEECDTCKRDVKIALEVSRSPEALINAICVVNVEGEKLLDRERWKLLRSFLIEMEEASRV